MVKERLAGWALVALSLVLLLASGRLELLALLLPLSILMGYGITRLGGGRTRTVRKRNRFTAAR